ncbi:DUF4301 family protein [Mariniflexile aquimaris]|uniref:DUF4301 family protein n=1 Tax=Mariniflexile aquimaris TaxID=881009 RepID=A0ABW3BP69_9FLAO
MFIEKDIQQIKGLGLTIEKVQEQVELIKSGMTYSNLVEASGIGNGILKVDSNCWQDSIDLFDNKRKDLSIVKFVPASGAASRMFKFLFQFLKDFDSNKESIETYCERNQDMKTFLNGYKLLPFYDDVMSEIKKHVSNFNDLSLTQQILEFVKTMLDENRLNYSFFPKGLLPFHKYSNHVATAFEEHLLEASLYASSNNEANLHFTISDAHENMFHNELKNIKAGIEEKTNTSFNVSFSFQSQATNTIAITATDDLYRDETGSLLFRPSGHGALLQNLNELDNDLIFIKNIDNIVVFEQNKKASEYKKLLAGILLKIQTQTFKYLKRLEDASIIEEELSNIELFAVNRLNIELDTNHYKGTLNERACYLHGRLNRPIRVCGMVKNEGEPGGGPFWVKDENGQLSLQIIEFAQIDFDNQEQKEIARNATHFNPTDLVCGVRNYKGEKFDLMQYVDAKAAFITLKSQNGVEIKALELPGLWNGSMAHWNSIFVEVPVSTFNPVKTVNDLLKPAHQV